MNLPIPAKLRPPAPRKTVFKPEERALRPGEPPRPSIPGPDASLEERADYLDRYREWQVKWTQWASCNPKHLPQEMKP